jgi:hypothetical protein
MRRRVLAVIALAGLFVLTSHEPVVGDEQKCGLPRHCSVSGGLDCIPAPTSLQPVPHDPLYPLFESPTYSGNCGFETCWLIFKCACGDPLTGAGCRLEEFAPSPDR